MTDETVRDIGLFALTNEHKDERDPKFIADVHLRVFEEAKAFAASALGWKMSDEERLESTIMLFVVGLVHEIKKARADRDRTAERVAHWLNSDGTESDEGWSSAADAILNGIGLDKGCAHEFAPNKVPGGGAYCTKCTGCVWRMP